MNMVPNVDMMVPNGVSAGGGSGPLTINTTPITGATGAILWDDTGFLQEVTIGSGLSFSGGTLTATGTGNPSPPVNSVQYDNAGAFGGASNFAVISVASGLCPNVPTSPGAYYVQGFPGLYTIPNVNGANWFEGNAGNTTTTGYQNFGTGDGALAGLTNGFQNTAIGSGALNLCSSGSQNTAFGNGALGSCTTGIGNTAIGENALLRNTTGQQNFALGIFALSNLASDGGHVAIGGNAMASHTGSIPFQGCVSIGAQALNNSISGYANIAIGSGCLQGITTNGANVAIGFNCLGFGNCTNSVGIGFQAGNGTNNNVVCIGYQAGFHTHGDNNVIIGAYDDFTPRSNVFVLNFGATPNITRVDYGITAAGWTFADLATAGLMTTNASGTIAIANAAPAATIAANFSATNRIQVNVGGTTYYIPADTVAW
jgi:hypothetical protein